MPRLRTNGVRMRTLHDASFRRRASSQQHPLDSALVRFVDVVAHPVLTEQALGHLDDDVIRVGPGVVVVARDALQARRAGSEYFDLAGEAVSPERVGAFAHLELLAKPDLGGDVGTRSRERFGFAAAAVVER